MQTTFNDSIPIVSQLNHNDKLRLAQWLINAIAQEEGINDSLENKQEQQTGLCGIWQDSRTAENITQEIVSNRTQGRDIKLCNTC